MRLPSIPPGTLEAIRLATQRSLSQEVPMSRWARAAAAVRADFSDLPDAGQVASLVIRLLMAALLGGVLGYERERAGKTAGVRTHMLVSMGAALFVLIPQQAGAAPGDITRVLQGIVAGI